MADKSKFRVGSTRQRPGIDETTDDDLTVTGALRRSREMYENVTGNKTLDEGDGGVIQRVKATCTITLPATAVGRCYPIEHDGADGTLTITISPNASDKIMGAGFTSADDKDIVCTNGNQGDQVILVGNADGWNVLFMQGTWVREA